ncbi:NAD-dependent epimerase/dehydratase family protein [Mariniluteicoccus flavus]
MKVWVSGARGNLGGEVCRQLDEAGHTVVPVDLKPGDDAMAVDLLDRHAVADSIAGCDAIIHCAGIPSPEDIEPADLVGINTLSTFNALEEGWKAGVRTAVLASSGSIYGTAWSDDVRHEAVPVDEDTPLCYVDPYALTKDFLERMGQMYARRGMTVTALRFHWILDPEGLREWAFPMAEADGANNLWGYVDRTDAARACVLGLTPRLPRAGTLPERAQRVEGAYHALLIAAADTVSHTPTAELLARHLPDTQVRAPLPGHVGGFDCSRARDVLGWEPRTRWRAE